MIHHVFSLITGNPTLTVVRSSESSYMYIQLHEVCVHGICRFGKEIRVIFIGMTQYVDN